MTMNDRGKTFIHKGCELAAEPFHYTQCGVDDVYLLSGFKLEKTAYGETFSIKNMEGLHEAIALWLITERETFSGKEVRFLRKQMKLTQEQLGDMIEIGGQMVARYEKDISTMPDAPAMLLRMNFLASILPDNETLKDLKQKIAEIKSHIKAQKAESARQKPLYLKTVRGTEWKVAAA